MFELGTNTTHHVNILLSTYNGARYLEPLLDSLNAQSYKNFSLWIRDDGSSDSTVALLKQYTKQSTNLSIIEGSNVGVIKSFLMLLAGCPAGSGQFYAFCDQDDVWKPEKLANALSKLNAAEDPASALYCSRLEYTDSQLNHLGYSLIPTSLGFENALVENVAIGCTMVFGNTLRQKILAANSEQMMMHDWWAYLVGSAFGKIIYDPEPAILYRQHASNVVGWDKRLPRLLKKASGFLRNIVRDRQGLECLRQAAFFLQTYPELSNNKQKLIREFLQLRQTGTVLSHYQFLKRNNIRRNHFIENLVLLVTMLLKLH